MTQEKLAWILSYKFKDFYASEADWQKDFERFKLALANYDSAH